MSYNGWTNWETWSLYSWISNDEETRRKALNMSVDNLSEIVSDHFDEDPQGGLGWIKDVAEEAMNLVNWQEVHDALHED